MENEHLHFQNQWTKMDCMGVFNSDEDYIYYCGQESLRRNGLALIVNKRVWNAVLGCNLKSNRMISINFQGKPFNITVIQVFAQITHAKEAEVEWFYDSRPCRTNTPERCPFHDRGLECKNGKSSDIWSNRQVWPWNTKWSRAKAKRVLPRERTGHSKHPLPTTQEKTTHWHHQVVNTKIRLIKFFAVEEGQALCSQQKRDWKLTVAQIMNSLLINADLNGRK